MFSQDNSALVIIVAILAVVALYYVLYKKKTTGCKSCMAQCTSEDADEKAACQKQCKDKHSDCAKDSSMVHSSYAAHGIIDSIEDEAARAEKKIDSSIPTDWIPAGRMSVDSFLPPVPGFSDTSVNQ